MPCSGPLDWPAPMSRSAWRASTMAASRISVTTAFSLRPTVSRRSRQAFVRSTGESFFVRMRADSSRTGRNRSRVSMSASGFEREVGFVAVRELGLAQRFATRDALVDLLGDVLHLVGVEERAVADVDHLREGLRGVG